jgi:hypothetical protein
VCSGSFVIEATSSRVSSHKRVSRYNSRMQLKLFSSDYQGAATLPGLNPSTLGDFVLFVTVKQTFNTRFPLQITW